MLNLESAVSWSTYSIDICHIGYLTIESERLYGADSELLIYKLFGLSPI
eukprot:SAG11_NODE_505_length_8888_cov_12.479235_2_plen_49_part_00